MKNLFIAMAVTLLFISCNSYEKKPNALSISDSLELYKAKAKIGIEEYMQNNLNDAKSYESVEIGMILPESTYCHDSKEYDVLYDSVLAVHSKVRNDSIDISIGYFFASSGKATKQRFKEGVILRTLLQAKMDSLCKAFQPEFKGYVGTHKFRANNKMGGKILATWRINFDKNFKVVDYTEW